ncbi:ThiF family adenylyltransferase [Paractinoplanes rhizophilus]|jgi:hypothetical protein|uniref:ThiF family adenylyltransferase n=1 Tax=Paractinoplanes rhizophilus TaxID=1416877 RepID=A0ABW2I5H1_9ACTN
MTNPYLVLVTSGTAARIAGSAQRWGRTAVAVDTDNELFGVIGSADGDASPVLDHPAGEAHPITRAQRPVPGLWAVVPPGSHETHADARRIGRQLRPTAFDAFFADVPVQARSAGTFVVATRQPGAAQEWAAWIAGDFGLRPLDIDILPPPSFDPLPDLGAGWPVEDLDRPVVVVGVGSIGSAVAHALARYGVREMVLVDPDRLRRHNLVRHQNTRAAIGQYKVDAMREAIGEQWPATRVTALRASVIAGADLMRPLFARSPLVICAADGVAARRTVSHLAWRAGSTAVFACVLRDGALGEVLRVRPWPGTPCLLCTRAALVKEGSFDPEPDLDAAYGTGEVHRPMTAIGSDLTMVAGLTAKLAVATLLENAGHYEHVIRPDWAMIGLRLDRGAPEPFDLFPGQLHWLPAADARPDCPTCGSQR